MGLFDRSLRRGLAVLFSLGLFFAITGTASAHAEHAKVYKAIPAIGSTIAQAPTTVTVFTLENINPDPKDSNLFVYGPGGELISQGDAKVSVPMSCNGKRFRRWTATRIRGLSSSP